jgi:ATP-dependent DNA helicase RecQ
MSEAIQILEKYWGYESFRKPQEEIIQAVLNQKNCLVLLPTGGGKSVCYQIPALISEGCCLVVSPLIALMKDQVGSLQKKGIKALTINSELSFDETIAAFDNLKFGGYKFLYLSPEKIQNELIQQKLTEINVSIIAIDEAHCISEWGHDFRPNYLKLKILKEIHPNATVIALTATATKNVMNDICQQLELKEVLVFKESFKRDNLYYSILHTQDVYGRLFAVLKKIKENIIIYTNSRRETKDLSNYLNKQEFKSSYYHGGLMPLEKQQHFDDWMQEKKTIMVATNAFGMGIDKSNVRCVIHINIPQSIENYVQEAGRAGRDGKPSYAISLTNSTQQHNAKSLLERNLVDYKEVAKVYNSLNQYYQVAYGELSLESYDFSMADFCRTYQLDEKKTISALKHLKTYEVISLDENSCRKSTLKFRVNSHQMLAFTDRQTSFEPLLNLIFRSYEGIFEHITSIDEYFLASRLMISRKEVIDKLNQLHSHGYVKYDYLSSTVKLKFMVNREDDYTIRGLKTIIAKHNKLKREKLAAVLHYYNNDKVCRNVQLLAYFGEQLKKCAGNCDVCNNSKKNVPKNLSELILKSLKDRELTSFELSEQLEIKSAILLEKLKELLNDEVICMTVDNKFTIFQD